MKKKNKKTYINVVSEFNPIIPYFFLKGIRQTITFIIERNIILARMNFTPNLGIFIVRNCLV